MPKGELFEDLRPCRPPLTPQERKMTVQRIVTMAQTACKYFYTLKETCAILHCSYDELQTILHQFRLDAVLFLDAYRIPWFDLAGFIIDDPNDTLEKDYNDYVRGKLKQI